MFDYERERSLPTAAVTHVGVDHVRLSYHYLDVGDIDAYASLLDERVEVRLPGAPRGRGREEVLRLHTEVARSADRHELSQVIAAESNVVVIGRLVRSTAVPPDPPDVEFVDVFTVSDVGLLLGYQRFHFTAIG